MGPREGEGYPWVGGDPPSLKKNGNIPDPGHPRRLAGQPHAQWLPAFCLGIPMVSASLHRTHSTAYAMLLPISWFSGSASLACLFALVLWPFEETSVLIKSRRRQLCRFFEEIPDTCLDFFLFWEGSICKDGRSSDLTYMHVHIWTEEDFRGEWVGAIHHAMSSAGVQQHLSCVWQQYCAH